MVSLIHGFEVYDRNQCDGLTFKLKDIDKVLDDLKTATVEDMAKNPNIGEKRASMFVPAVVMLQEIFSGLGANTIVASLRSAKDGIVEELISYDKTHKIR